MVAFKDDETAGLATPGNEVSGRPSCKVSRESSFNENERERAVDLWVVDEMESDFNEGEGDTVSRVFSMFRSVTVN